MRLYTAFLEEATKYKKKNLPLIPVKNVDFAGLPKYN